MGADQRDVDAAGDQRFERRIGRGLGKAVEPAVLQVWDARRKLKAEQSEEREDVIGIATAVGVMAANRDLALVIQEAVEGHAEPRSPSLRSPWCRTGRSGRRGAWRTCFPDRRRNGRLCVR